MGKRSGGLNFAPRVPIKHQQERARRHLAYPVLYVYLGLLVASIAVPTILYIMNRPRTAVTLDDAKDLILAIFSALGSVVGILGFIVGFYFKSLENDRP